MARSKKTVEVVTETETESVHAPPPPPQVRVTWRSWGAWATTICEGERILLRPDVTYELVDETTTTVTLKDEASGKHVTLRRGMVERA